MRNRYRTLSRYELKSLLYHLTEAGRWDVISHIYMDLELAEALFEKDVHDAAVGDYSLTLEKVKPHATANEFSDMQAFADFIRSESDYLKEHPADVIQQAENQPENSLLHQKALSLLQNFADTRPRFRWINKAASVGPLLLRLRQESWINCCAWQSDEEVVSANYDGLINVWNVRSGELISSRNTSGAKPLCFSPDARLLLASDSDRVVIIDVRTGTHIREIIHKILRVSSCAWSRDARHIAIGGDDGHLIVLNRDTGKTRHLLKGGAKVECCAWSPDADRLVWCPGAEALVVWDFRNSKRIGKLGNARWVVKGSTHTWTTFKGHKGGANAVAWSPDGRHIASGSGHGFGMHNDDFSVRIWDSKSLKEIAVLRGHQDRVTSLSWSPDARFLASTSGSVMTPAKDNSVRLWDMKSFTARGVLAGHSNEVVSCTWHSDARRLVSASKDETLIVWDAQKSGDASDPILRIYVSPDGKRAALARKDNAVAIVDAASGKELERFYGHKDEVSACAWSPDGLLLANGSLDRTTRVWDTVSKKSVAVLRGHTGEETYTAGGGRVVWGAVTDIDWSPDGRLLATCGSDRVLMIWSRKTWSQYRRLLGHVGPIRNCAWSSDGRKLVSLGGSFEHIIDNAALLWDVESGCELGKLSPDAPEWEVLTNRPEHSRSFNRAVSLDRLGTAKIKEEKIWPNHELEISHAAVRPRWKLKIRGDVSHIAWFLDGRHFVFATGSTIRLLDAVDQRELLRFPAKANLAQLCIADGGNRILAADQAGGFYILSVEGISLGLPAMKVSKRWHAHTQKWDKDYSGVCPLCGNLVRACAAADVIVCAQCKSDVRPILDKTLNTTSSSLVPLDKRSGEAWLRIIRGLLINETAEDDTIASLYRQIAVLEPEGKTFTSAIRDPYGTEIAQVNSALWSTGGYVLWGEEHLVEKCLRTALRHKPDDEALKAQLASVFIANGRKNKARRLLQGVSSRVLTASIHDAIDAYRALGDTASEERLSAFATANINRPPRRKADTTSQLRK